VHQLTPDGLFAAVLAAQPDRPLVTWYDETPGRGVRVELSARSLATWAAKTAGLVTDELGLGPGDRVVLTPVDHWLVPGLLAGLWNAGVEVVTDPVAAGAAIVPRDGGATPDADEVFTLDPTSPLQLGAPDDAPGAPAGSRDLPTALRPHPDRPGPGRGTPESPALDGRSGAEVVAAAHDRAAALGLADGARLLWTEGLSGTGVVDAVLAPWTVRGSLVLVTADGPVDPDRVAAIAAAEAADVVH
jgi:uncharacterized protein (TIGR03089 family)